MGMQDELDEGAGCFGCLVAGLGLIACVLIVSICTYALYRLGGLLA